MKKFWKVFVLLISISMVLTISSCDAMADSTIAKCNGLEINKSTFILKMAEEAVNIYKEQPNKDIQQIIEEAKTNTLEYLKLYTYYKQGYTAAKMELTPEEAGNIRASIVSVLMESGLKYEEKTRDTVFFEKFGVNFEQYMVYHEEIELSRRYEALVIEQVVVSEEDIRGFYENNKKEYGICTAELIYIEAEGDKIEEIETLFRQGVQLGQLETDFSNEIKKSGRFTFNETSNLDEAFGAGFVENAVQTEVGDVIKVNNQQGITLGRITETLGYQQNHSKIKEGLQNEKFVEMRNIEVSSYGFEIVQSEYDKIITIPGIKQ